MFQPFIILLAIALSNGLQYPYNGLRVKIGWSDALADQEYFFKIPRTINEAEAQGWTRTERPPGPIPELRMYCPKGRAVCPLYDTSGFVAGLQIALPADEFEQPFKPEKNFVKWVVPATATEPAATYWAISQYYVSEETLKAGSGPTSVNGATLQDGGVWVKGPDGELMRIPNTVAELNTTKFVKQNCVPNMGTHYYYGLSKNMKCDDFFPWFPLTTSNDQLIGLGFQIIGKLTRSKPVDREWFELDVFKKGSLSLVAPDAPACLPNLLETYDGVFLHIYFIDEPWTITCSSGDSVKPAPLLDRVVLTAYRYANSVADNFKNLF